MSVALSAVCFVILHIVKGAMLFPFGGMRFAFPPYMG